MCKDIEMLPNTRQVRDFYCHARQGTTQRWGDHSFEAEFDAFLAAHDAEIAARTATILSQLFPETEGDVGVKSAAVRKWLGFRAAEYRKAVD